MFISSLGAMKSYDRFFEEVADLTLRELSDENSRLARENARRNPAAAPQHLGARRCGLQSCLAGQTLLG